MYKIKVNDQFDFEVEATASGYTVNNEPLIIDSSISKTRHANIIHQHRSYNVELVGVGEDKVATIKVNGTAYRVQIQDRYDQLLHQLGMDNLTAGKVKEVKAPMPGLVLNISVQEGQEVKKGDNLVILEAMKMENILKSPSDGKVSKIMVKTGDKLEKGTVLIRFE